MRGFEQKEGFIRGSDYVDTLPVLGVAKVFTVPSLAKHCRLSGTTDFYYRYGATTVTAPSTTIDGSGGALVPSNGIAQAFLIVTPADTIAVNTSSTATTSQITAEYWGV